MRFKEFLQEDANSSETGLFANIPAKDTGHRVPSDGQPFSQYLNIASGSKPSQSGGGGLPGGSMMGGATTGNSGMFMKKLMRKMMLKKMKKD